MTNTVDKQKEEAQKRASTREYALKNLKAQGLSNLAVAYVAQNKQSGFGDTDNGAVEEFLYTPAMSSGTKVHDLESGDEVDFMRNALMSSRKDGQRYSGRIDEYDVIKSAASITQQSLSSVKVSDVYELLGSKAPIDEAYKDKYIFELLKSENKEDKELATTLIGTYMTYITTKGVSKALEQRAGSLRSGLEDLVKPEEKKK